MLPAALATASRRQSRARRRRLPPTVRQVNQA
jgi:hypothetical protein